MNKKELIDALASKTGKTRKEASEFVEAFVGVVTEELKNGGAVNLVGFGAFKVVERPPREARNPRTGEKIQIPARKVPVFKAGKALKEMFS